MGIEHKCNLKRLGVALSAGLFIATTGNAPAISDPQAQSLHAMLIPSDMQRLSAPQSKVPAPQAGVKLLEGILQHLHNLPQLAFAKNKPSVTYQQQVASPAPPPVTDQLLAIKPKEQVKHTHSVNNPWNTISMAAPQASYAGAKKLQMQTEDEDFLRDYKDARKAPSDEPAPGGTLNQKAARNQYQSKGLSNEAARRLSNSAGNLYNISKQMEEAGQAGAYRQSNGAIPPASTLSGAPSFSQNNGYAGGNVQLGSLGGSRSRSVQIAKSPLITEFKSQAPAEFDAERNYNAPSNWGQNNQSMRGGADGAQIALQPSQPGLYEHIREFFGANKTASESVAQPKLDQGRAEGDAKFEDNSATVAGSLMADKFRRVGSNVLERQDVDKLMPAGASNNRLKEVAMLPVNVVGGIPMVKLGASSAEAARTLARMGQVSQQNIDGWTVMSVSRPHTKDTLVQLYVKHGMVEAMRVFDASVAPNDLGVKLGDALPAVKSKFGEPSFIITEPSIRSDKNYVYPISQICFQLARRNPSSTEPQVVSMLIFNVK